MKISTKGRYALRMMLDLAQHGQYDCVALKDIAARQEVSKKYLEQIVPILNKAGLLKTLRGYQGGYMLAKLPSEYTVGEILRATEGSLAPIPCVKEEPIPCERAYNCITYPMWKGLSKVINDYLDGITLQDLLDKHAENGANEYII